MMRTFSKTEICLSLALVLVHLRGLFLDIMDVDAAQYASIAAEMLKNGQYLQVLHRGADYLDKPPLLFWLSAGAYGLFGFHNWAYKLPSFLAAWFGIYATYRFARLFYPEQTARAAGFILAAALGFVLITNDIRTDTLLLAATAGAIWLLAEYLRGEGWRHLFAAFGCIGLAMLAKGPIGLVMPAFALGTHLLLRRDGKKIFHAPWLAGLCWSLLCLLPMCWGLYQQFDLQPEKLVNERTGVSGLRFFFWEQSFGRITGENVWKDDSTPLYFFHTYLWAFLPWPFLLAGGLWRRFQEVFVQKFRISAADEGFSLGGFVLTFVALSFSHYKLPHYIFITFPAAAVLTARFLFSFAEPAGLFNPETPHASALWPRQKYLGAGWVLIQYFVLLVLAAMAFVIPGFVFFSKNLLLWAGLLGIFGVLLIWVSKKPLRIGPSELLNRSLLAAIGLGCSLNFCFYPALLPFQAPAAVGRFAKTHGLRPEQTACFRRHSHALDVYSGWQWPLLPTASAVQRAVWQKERLYLFTTEAGKNQLERNGLKMKVLQTFEHFQVARLSPEFLNPATRAGALETVFLLELGGER